MTRADACDVEMTTLRDDLESMTPGRQRCVLSLLGLAVGDAVGLPFELWTHRRARQDADEIARQGDAAGLREFLLGLIIERLGRRGVSNPFARTYSDDTVCADLRMAAVAQWTASRPLFRDSVADGDLMWRCLLSQMLGWAYGTGGKLFQGYGAFTKALLKPRVDAPPFRRIEGSAFGRET